MKHIYVPEYDNGEWARGKAFLSADMWVPKEQIRNVPAFLRSATVTSVDARSGELTVVTLAREDKYHVVVARHLFSTQEWRERLQEPWIVPAYEWGSIGLTDKVVPRDHLQEVAWDYLSASKFGVLELACGKGKTVLFIKKIVQSDVPTLIVVNNEGLVSQWVDRLTEFTTLEKSDIGIIQGPKKELDKPVSVAMIHTLANMSYGMSIEDRLRYGMVVFDEVHHLAAAKFSLTAPLVFGDRFGLTATTKRNDNLEGVYYAHIGPPFYTDLVGDLDADIFFVKMDTKAVTSKTALLDRAREFSAAKMYAHLANDVYRNTLILNMVEALLQDGRKVLAVTHSKEHPAILQGMLLRRRPELVVGAVTGSTLGPERLRVIKSSNVSFATVHIATEGLDVSEVDTMLFLTPFKAWAPFQQGKGRTERTNACKRKPLVAVLDDIRIGPAHAMCNSLRKSVRSHGFTFRESTTIPTEHSS